MTAHLALAAALRPDGASASREGRFANAALHLLAGRGQDAATALDALDADGDRSPEAAVWRRALRLRLTLDTRTPFEPTSFLERRELYRARLWTTDGAAALRYAEELGDAESTDRWRLASETGVTVEVGNTLLPDALEQELAEAREVGILPSGTPPSDAALVTALNEPAERCVTPVGPRAIGRGTWAAFLQRHLIHGLWSRDQFTREMLGLPDAANQELRAAGQRFGRLTLYPVIEVRCSLDARRRPQRFDDLVTLSVERPELIPAFQWWASEDVARSEVIRRGMPTLTAWFVPGVPRGTTFDTVGRERPRLLPQEVGAMRSFRAISPQDVDVAQALVAVQFPKQAPLAELEDVFGSRAEYDMRILNQIAQLVQGNPADYGRVLERQCSLSPGHCFPAGYNLVERGEIAAAAVAYQRGMDLGPDRVFAANNAQWLMNHYLDVGQNARAQAVAAEAAGTGSFGGLLTQSRFLERTGDPEGAEQILLSARDRYGNKPQNPDEREETLDGQQDEDQLVGFYYRMAFVRKRHGYEGRFHELADDDFPGGLEKLDRSSLSGRPSDGVFILKIWPQAERAGLKAGDIIVGLDGYRIRTRRQYYLVRTFTDAPEVSLVVFRHPGYVDVKGRAAWRRLGFDMRSHKPLNAAAGS